MNGPTAAAVLASFWVLLSIAALLIAARLWLRIRIQTKNLLLSDALLVISWFGSLIHAILAIVFASEGALHPKNDYTLLNWQVDVKKVEYVTKLIWIGALAFFTSLYFCKFALLAIFMQLFPRSMRALRIALYATTAFCGCGYLITMALHIFICWPIEGNWSFASNPDAVCSSQHIITIFYIGWSLHFSANIAIIILPFFVLRGLQVKRKTMVGIYAAFSLGFIDLAFSLTRFLIIHLRPGSFKPLTLILLLSMLDENMAIIVACLPSLRPYLRHGFKSSSAEASTFYGYGGQSGNRVTIATNGFERMDNTYRTVLSTGTDQHGNSNEDAWSDGKKSNRSDIELVRVQAEPEGFAGGIIGPSKIRVDQEIIVSRDMEHSPIGRSPIGQAPDETPGPTLKDWRQIDRAGLCQPEWLFAGSGVPGRISHQLRHDSMCGEACGEGSWADVLEATAGKIADNVHRRA